MPKKKNTLKLTLNINSIAKRKFRLEKTFKKAAKDIEIVSMAEEGWVDYKRQLEKLKI